MTNIPNYTQDDIRSQAGTTIYARGDEYYQSGAVEELVQRGNVLHAEVEGSEPEPYHVTIHFTATGIGSVACTCPYGGWCKHVVATLLTALENKQQIETRPTIDALLQNLTREQLYSLLLHLAEETRNVETEIEAWVAQQQLKVSLPPAQPATTQPALTLAPLDAKTTKVQIRKALKGVSKVNAASQLLDQVSNLIESGSYDNAYLMLDTLTDEFVADLPDSYEGYYDQYDEEGGDDGSADLLPAFDDLWAELVLSSSFPKAELETIDEKLADWDETIEESQGDTALDTARLAIEYGWDYPPLQRAMAGEITEKGAWEDEAPMVADQLAIVRLRILKRQGRTQEYLNLAQAEGQFTLYLLMLVEMGRLTEATSEAIELLADVNEIFKVVEALQQRGAIEEAVQVAQHGLAQKEGLKHNLAKWLHGQYVVRSDHKNATSMLITMIVEKPTLADYQQLQKSAADEWPQVKMQILDLLRKSTSFYADNRAKAEIFLSEGLWDDAIAAVDNGFDSDTLVFVMQHLYKHRPDWVVQKAKQNAESIMDAGKANRYDSAIQWLTHVKKAYQAVDRSAEWISYFQSIRNQHQRKYKLMEMFTRL